MFEEILLYIENGKYQCTPIVAHNNFNAKSVFTIVCNNQCEINIVRTKLEVDPNQDWVQPNKPKQ